MTSGCLRAMYLLLFLWSHSSIHAVIGGLSALSGMSPGGAVHAAAIASTSGHLGILVPVGLMRKPGSLVKLLSRILVGTLNGGDLQRGRRVWTLVDKPG